MLHRLTTPLKATETSRFGGRLEAGRVANERVWFGEVIAPEEVAFEPGVFLLCKSKAQALKAGVKPGPAPGAELVERTPEPAPSPQPSPSPESRPVPDVQLRTIRLIGMVPPEVWNRLGTKILAKLRTGSDLKVGIDFSVTVDTSVARGLVADLQQIVDDLGLKDRLQIQDS